MPNCWTNWSAWSGPSRYGRGWSGSSCSPCTAADGTPAARVSGRVRVALIDDHPMFRAGLRVALETGTDITVVAEAGRVDEAIDSVGRATPAGVLMDLHLPDGSGVEATRQLIARHHDLPVL